MANEIIYGNYLDQLVQMRKQYEKNPLPSLSEEIKVLRYKALMSNIDLAKLERDAFIEINGTTTGADKWVADHKLYFEEASLTKQYVDIKNKYEAATNANVKAQLKAELKAVRMRVYQSGLDVWKFELRSWEIWSGKPLEGDTRTNQFAEVQKAIDTATGADKNNGSGSGSTSGTSGGSGTITKVNHNNVYNETYSGADMLIYFAFPGYKPLEIGVASTVGYTTYREQKQVRTVGRVSAKGITKGQRTVSGRLIFTIIREHITEILRNEIPYLKNVKTILMDELPPFDILVSFGNEYGASAGLVIEGVSVVDEQKTMSIEDLFTENLFTYLARGIQPMRTMNVAPKEYDPLEWYTSSFRGAEDNRVSSFKPKELQLYEDVALLPSPKPFNGSIAGWDSSQYELGELAENLGVNGEFVGIPSGDGAGEGSQGGGGSDAEEFPGNINDGLLIVQVVTTRNDKWYPEGVGNIHLFINGKRTATLKISKYKKDYVGVRMFEIHKDKTKQEFPIYEGDVFYCAYMLKPGFKKGDKIRVMCESTNNAFLGVDLEQTATSAHQTITMKATAVGASSVNMLPAAFNYVSQKGETNVHPYWYQNMPKKSSSGTKQVLEMTEGLFAAQSKQLATKIVAEALTKEKIPIQGIYVTLSWFIDFKLCDKVDSKWNPAEDQQVTKLNAFDSTSNSSLTAEKAWVAENGGKQVGYRVMQTDKNGKVEFGLLGTFWSVSKPYKKKRYSLYWDDLPHKARLIYKVQMYGATESSVKGTPKAVIHVGFIKGLSKIDNNNPYWRAIGRK